MVGHIWCLIMGALFGMLGTLRYVDGHYVDGHPKAEKRKTKRIFSKVSIPHAIYCADPKRAESLALGKLAKEFVNGMLKHAEVIATDSDDERIYTACVDVVVTQGVAQAEHHGDAHEEDPCVACL